MKFSRSKPFQVVLVSSGCAAAAASTPEICSASKVSFIAKAYQNTNSQSTSPVTTGVQIKRTSSPSVDNLRRLASHLGGFEFEPCGNADGHFVAVASDDAAATGKRHWLSNRRQRGPRRPGSGGGWWRPVAGGPVARGWRSCRSPIALMAGNFNLAAKAAEELAATRTRRPGMSCPASRPRSAKLHSWSSRRASPLQLRRCRTFQCSKGRSNSLSHHGQTGPNWSASIGDGIRAAGDGGARHGDEVAGLGLVEVVELAGHAEQHGRGAAQARRDWRRPDRPRACR